MFNITQYLHYLKHASSFVGPLDAGVSFPNSITGFIYSYQTQSQYAGGVWGETCGYWLVATSRITNSSYQKLPELVVVIGHTTAVRHIMICG